jgi:hypothetical protein
VEILVQANDAAVANSRGAGAQVLQSAIAQSRVVLLGEDHGVAQTTEF